MVATWTGDGLWSKTTILIQITLSSKKEKEKENRGTKAYLFNSREVVNTN